MDSLSCVLEGIRGQHTRPVLVGIEGRSGSRKSFLSERLSKALGCSVIHGDDFYSVMPEDERAALTPEQGYALYFDWQRLRLEALNPLKARCTARFQRYDWERGSALKGWIRVAPAEVVIVEGVYLGRPELRSFFDVLVYISTPESERRQRLKARTWDDPAWTARWDAAEGWYHDHHEPEEKAQFVVSGAS